MFHYDRGLVLTEARLAVDHPRRQPRAFVSHAHFDHMARHELALCTPETARLYRHRLGPRPRPVVELPYGQPVEFGPLRLTTFPAGHCLGSAMLLADDGQQRLLYTGDFKLAPPLTCAPAEIVAADILVMESTYGDPAYCFPPRERVVAELVERVADVLQRGGTPVVQAYTLGKAQEVSRILADAGFTILQHPDIFVVSEIYRACGITLGNFSRWEGELVPGGVLIVPPHLHRSSGLGPIARPVTIGVSGWGLKGPRRGGFRTDHVVPLSDHAGFDELIEFAERVGAREIYCTHGPPSFVEELRSRGLNARRLDDD